MIFTYFTNVETLEELRNQYKKLAMKHHPDRGGDTATMQAINNEYETLLKLVGNKRKNRDGQTYTKESYNAEQDRFREIIEKIINFEITIEICGSWIWISNGYQYRKQLKNLGFFWCSTKKAWAWADDPTTNGFRVSMDRIREIYGSEIIKKTSDSSLRLQTTNA